jgi:hypothetical protein
MLPGIVEFLLETIEDDDDPGLGRRALDQRLAVLGWNI